MVFRLGVNNWGLWIIRRLRKKKRQSERALKALKEATKEVKVEDE
ncbi:sortase family protein [Streptococcus pneumoniae]|nr:sortase family protein [Streptococcus pneumoniae]